METSETSEKDSARRLKTGGLRRRQPGVGCLADGGLSHSAPPAVLPRIAYRRLDGRGQLF